MKVSVTLPASFLGFTSLPAAAVVAGAIPAAGAIFSTGAAACTRTDGCTNGRANAEHWHEMDARGGCTKGGERFGKSFYETITGYLPPLERLL